MSPSVRAVSSSAAETKKDGAPWHDHASYAVALAVIAFFLVTSLWISLKRLLWFDELMTFQIAGIPDTSTFWAALHRGFDGMPPAYYLLERFLLAHIHPAELALRLPSVLAVCVGVFVVYDCARRLTGAFFGLFAMAVVLVSFVVYYSYEARSYGLYFLCSALALWVWCHVHRRLGPVLFGACFFAGMMMHDYFFICLTPYVLYEILRWRPGRWPSAKFIGGAVGLVFGILILTPQLAAQRAFNTVFWARPTLAGLIHIYNSAFPFGVAVATFTAAWLILGPSRSSPAGAGKISQFENVSWLYLTIPLAGYLAAELFTHAFVDRYFICFVSGLAVGLACLCQRHFGICSVSATGVLLVMFGLGMADQARFGAHPETADYVRSNPDYEQLKTKAFLTHEAEIGADGKHSILLCEALLFSQVRHYSARRTAYHYLYDPNTTGDRLINQRLLVALNDYVPQNLWTLRDLEQNAGDSAVVDLPSEDLQSLEADGFRMTLAKKFGEELKHPIEIFYLSR